MQTLMISGEDTLMREVKALINDFVHKKGVKVQIQENTIDNRTSYNSLEELQTDYAKRIEDIKSGKDKLTPLREGLDEMMDRVKQKYVDWKKF